MPIIKKSTYKSPFWAINGHIDTIYPALFRKVKLKNAPKHVTISTPDDDFFDIDYYDNHTNRTLIISHGLEGNSKRPYVLGMAMKFYENGWNVIAWNYRGCNGKMNNSLKSYHSGFTDDLEEVIRFADCSEVDFISLVGFSLGGNLSLKYLGEKEDLNPKIRSAVTFSVPLDLHKGCLQISRRNNQLYSGRFLRSLKKKTREKAAIFHEIDTSQLSNMNNLMIFDDHYTAPMHGFKDAMDYYTSCSAIYFLKNITIPTLIVNALNDPFLPIECYPFVELDNNEFVHLETPEKGGHVGFYSKNKNGFYWSEERAHQFISSAFQ